MKRDSRFLFAHKDLGIKGAFCFQPLQKGAIRSIIDRVANNLRVHHSFVRFQAQQSVQFIAIDHSQHDRAQVCGGTVQIDILADKSRIRSATNRRRSSSLPRTIFMRE